MTDPRPYTTRLQAGLGVVDETMALLELWEPGVTAPELRTRARESGRFPNVTARRLRNVIVECFAPRFLVDGGKPARALKTLAPAIPIRDLLQLLLLHTARANAILADFIRDVYWERYASGHGVVSNQEAAAFVRRGLEAGRMASAWSDLTVRRVSGYLTGCCADYGLLESRGRTSRKIQPVHLSSALVLYLAHDLHFSGLGDNTLLQHPDWALFGLGSWDVLKELERLQRNGHFLVQSGGNLVRISWNHQSLEEACESITQG